jgi:hypothetical protein
MDHFAQYQVYNDMLLAFIMRGQGDTKGADAIRDLMDEQWKNMTEEEQKPSRQINEKAFS